MPKSWNHFPEVGRLLATAISQVVKKTAVDIQEGASINAPVDTGFLRSSIYVVTSKDSTYGKYARMTSKGKRVKTKVDTSEMLPEVEKPDDDWTAYIAVGASYGIYVEMGTRFMPAQPYLAPAVETIRGPFEQAMGEIEKTIKELLPHE